MKKQIEELSLVNSAKIKLHTGIAMSNVWKFKWPKILVGLLDGIEIIMWMGWLKFDGGFYYVDGNGTGMVF